MEETDRSELPGALRFWAKTLPDGSPGIDVHQHLLRVGAVAKILAEDRGTWLRGFRRKSSRTFRMAELGGSSLLRLQGH